MDTSSRFQGIDTICHRRDGQNRVTLFFPEKIRALDLTVQEAADLAGELLRLSHTMQPTRAAGESEHVKE
ncbi:hypothetical protein [Corynebacterium flavescens]|uniref:hypothetical protein n=1 Tax=Corynebacterium flavescens TaxID=28028 RepID=UPI00289881CB|nr:hypothetical protein [Corynebacterium flavescens]